MSLDLRRTLGPLVVEWMEANLVHGPGDVQGQPLRLDDEQVRFLCAAYAIDDHGRRLVRRAVYSRAKGRAKSELAAAICCAEALGPVRFGGWDAAGYPVGVPVLSPFIKVVATEEGQAGNTYGAIEVMLREGPVGQTPGLDVGRTRTFIPGGGEIRAVSSASASKDGGKETFANFDETHLFRGPELVGVHATIRRNLAKRKAAEPWSLETSTMYAPGEDSVAETAHVYASKIARGDITDGGFLFDHLEGPQVVDFFDDHQIVQSLRVAYGEASAWMDFDRLLAEANEARESVDSRRMVADFRRYFLNQPTRAEESVWVPPTVWAGLADEAVPALPPDGARVGVGVEVDITGTLAAVGVAWEHDGRTAVAATMWSARKQIPAHHTQDADVLDLGAVDDLVAKLAARCTVTVHRDERFWPGDELVDRGVQVDAMTQSDLVTAAGRFHQAAHGCALTHTGDRVLTAMVGATKAIPNDTGWRVVKAKAEVWPVATVAVIRALHSLQDEAVSHYESSELLVI